jgi:WD40 repeat protein
MIHYPPVGLIHSLSLSYPPPVVTDTPPRTQRERYEALAPRLPPYVLSAGLDVGVVRSDPLTAKVSKGFWSPTGFHLRPHHDFPPSAMYLPSRNQSHVLWGLLAGDVVHTSVRSAQKGRASHSVFSKPGYSHEGAVLDIHSSDPEGNVFVTAGEDGRVKLWRLESGKRGHIACVWTSGFATAQENRSDAIKLRQAQRPDPVILARCDADVVAGVTEDGDLRVWLEIGGTVREIRVDVGEGKVKQMELQGTSVLIRHDRSEAFARYDIGEEINVTHYDAGTPITSLEAFLQPSLAITTPSTASFGRLVIGGDDAGGVHIWSWDGGGAPVRSWRAAKGRITAIDYSCGLVAVARYV